MNISLYVILMWGCRAFKRVWEVRWLKNISPKNGSNLFQWMNIFATSILEFLFSIIFVESRCTLSHQRRYPVSVQFRPRNPHSHVASSRWITLALLQHLAVDASILTGAHYLSSDIFNFLCRSSDLWPLAYVTPLLVTCVHMWELMTILRVRITCWNQTFVNLESPED